MIAIHNKELGYDNNAKNHNNMTLLLLIYFHVC